MKHSQFHYMHISSLLLLLAVSGCSSMTPMLDRHFGESVNLAKAQQTLHPEASRNQDTVRGMDGKAAKSAYDAYQKSYTTPPPPSNVFAIGVGAGR